MAKLPNLNTVQWRVLKTKDKGTLVRLRCFKSTMVVYDQFISQVPVRSEVGDLISAPEWSENSEKTSHCCLSNVRCWGKARYFQ